MQINIKDYLSDDEIKEIVKDNLKEKLREMFNTEKKTAIMISNLGYYNTFKIIEEEIPNFKDLIKQKTKEHCENMSSYHVFRSKREYEYDSKSSLAQDYLEQAVKENKELINKRVIEIINGLSKQDIAEEIKMILEEKIDNLLVRSDNNVL